MIEKKMLFSPGPVMTSKRVKGTLAHPDLCHRRPVFERVIQDIRTNLLTVFGADDKYATAIISGSGTAANETALSSIIKDGEQVLLIKNGEFGERLEEILTCYYKEVNILSYQWGTLPELSEIESALYNNEKIRWVCLVYHETSTGMINPVQEIGVLVKRYNRRLFVDCVSAIGGEDINMIRDNMDICSGSANKAVAGIPGVSFVVAKRDSIPQISEISRRNVYLNLQKHISIADNQSQTPNTPSVTSFIALNEALQELLDEGVEKRIQRHRECARFIRQGVKELQLRTLIPDELSSNTVTSVFLPEDIQLDEFIDELDRRGYIVYPGKRHLYQAGLFQIANMGQIQIENCREFMLVLSETLSNLSSKEFKVESAVQ